MSAPFIDDTGFHPLGLDGWIALVKSDYQAIYGTDFTSDSFDNSPDGQWLTNKASRLNDLEQLLMQVYLGRSPAGAVGAGLSRLVMLNGIARKAAQYSTAPATLSGTPGTVVPINSLVGSDSDSTKPAFKTTTALTIGSGGTVNGQVRCTVAGPIPAITGELSVPLTVVSGWTGVTNTANAAPGSNVEADPILRARRAASVAMPSQSLRDGLEAALRNLPGVTDARVYENDTGAPDRNGQPPHSIRAIVNGGADADIARAIAVKASMGVTKVGARSLDVFDLLGEPHTMWWDVPSQVNVYVTIKLDHLPPNRGRLQQQFGDAIVAYYALDGDLPALIGNSIYWSDILTPVNALGLTGRKGLPAITAIHLGATPNPNSQIDLGVPVDAIAVFDQSRIQVVGP
jgi:uncharacterized phage protein gp47/JayE